MNDFTKDELIDLESFLSDAPEFFDDTDETLFKLYNKVKFMIDNYVFPENTTTIGTGQLLFHNKESESGIIAKIRKQLALCDNSDETKLFRIDWKIIYGKKYE